MYSKKKPCPLPTHFSSLEANTGTRFCVFLQRDMAHKNSKQANIVSHCPPHMAIYYPHSAFCFFHLMYIRDPSVTMHLIWSPSFFFTAVYYSTLWISHDVFKQFGIHLFQTFLFSVYSILVSSQVVSRTLSWVLLNK